MEDSEVKYSKDLPRTKSLSSQDFHHSSTYFEVYQYDALPMISEDSASTAQPDVPESLSSTGSSRVQHLKLDEVVSSYKHIKTSLIVICILDVVLFLFAMIMITVLLIVVSKDWKTNTIRYDISGDVQTLPKIYTPSKTKTKLNHQIIQKPTIMNKDIYKDKLKVRCSDINKYLYNTGKQEAEYCTLADVLTAANKFIRENLKEMIDNNKESEATAIKVCCNTRPVLQIRGTNPSNDVSTLNQFQFHMRNWTVVNSQAMQANSEGEITIPREGSFFLYSRLEFEVEGGGVEDQPVTQTVKVKHPKGRKYRDRQISRHKCPGDERIHSVSLETVSHFKAGHRLKVVFKFPENVTATIQHIGIFEI